MTLVLRAPPAGGAGTGCRAAGARAIWLGLAVGLAPLLALGCASAPSEPPPAGRAPGPAVAEEAPLPPARSRKLRIDLGTQSFRYYEDGRLVRTGPVSAGSPEHPTPSGRFTVLSKEKDKVSRSYTNAFDMPTPMPYALQFSGPYYIHEGWLPGYADSHGCVRLHYEDARFLFERMRRGDPVLITQGGPAEMSASLSPKRPEGRSRGAAPSAGPSATGSSSYHQVIRSGSRQHGEWLRLDDPRRRW